MDEQEVLSAFEEKLRATTSDTERIDAINDFIWYNFEVLPEVCVAHLENAFKLSRELNYRKGIAYGSMALAYLNTTAYNKLSSMVTPQQAVEIAEQCVIDFQELNDMKGLGRAYNMLSYQKWWMGKYDEGLQNAFKALRSAEQVNDHFGLGWSNYALAVFHYDLKDYTTGEKHFSCALEHFGAVGDRYGVSRSMNGLASLKLAIHQDKEAGELLEKVLANYRSLKYRQGEARALNDLGILCIREENYEKAKDYLEKALDMRKTDGYVQGTTSTLIELAKLSLITGKPEDARKLLEEALAMAKESGAKPKEYAIHEKLAEVYKKLNDPWKVIEHLESFHTIQNEVTGEQQRNKMKNLQTTHATEKAENEKEIERLKNVELKKAYDQINEKNKEILDSINYARRLQQAILPAEKEWKKHLPESFVLYKPKDIVAGDFYWMTVAEHTEERKKKNEEPEGPVSHLKYSILVAACDCTGHGVPGAMVSVVCHNALDRSVREFGLTDPAAILDKARELVIEQFEKSDEDVKDGMDISLASLELRVKNEKLKMGGAKPETLNSQLATHNPQLATVLRWAGANNPLWIIRKGKLQEYKPNKQPIGKFSEAKPFTGHEIPLQPGDMLYIFTDGYQDQFGGEKGKKFKASNLQQLLLNIYPKPVDEQHAILQEALENWRGNLEQVDDVCVIGIRIL